MFGKDEKDDDECLTNLVVNDLDVMFEDKDSRESSVSEEKSLQPGPAATDNLHLGTSASKNSYLSVGNSTNYQAEDADNSRHMVKKTKIYSGPLRNKKLKNEESLKK